MDSSTLITLLIFASIFALAAMGGLMSERSGVVNIGLEGKMLISACATGLVAMNSGNAVLGLVCGLLAAILLSLCHFLLTQIYKIEHIVSGMAINLVAYGITNFAYGVFNIPAKTANVPKLSQWIYVGAAFVSALLIFGWLNRTRGGLHILAVGNSPQKARSAGISPFKVRLQALVWTGILCGLSGALIVTNSGSFSDNMTAGRGFIALAALILGGWRPITTLLACAAFAFFETLQIQLQGKPVLGIEFPPTFWSALPYLITLIALAGFVGRAKAPSGLGQS